MTSLTSSTSLQIPHVSEIQRLGDALNASQLCFYQHGVKNHRKPESLVEILQENGVADGRPVSPDGC